jgi:hypothetical protein
MKRKLYPVRVEVFKGTQESARKTFSPQCLPLPVDLFLKFSYSFVHGSGIEIMELL